MRWELFLLFSVKECHGYSCCPAGDCVKGYKGILILKMLGNSCLIFHRQGFTGISLDTP